ncbi:unnamed protein product [Brachionus calyciflorus]|uniref:Uncharacterized protein n=1 Tax=Brachionus calyciflorus TaxID=104777 RepID=A0A814MX19_9BILA|nr:unnamed protein product [Brachionus calyciflorus]
MMEKMLNDLSLSQDSFDLTLKRDNNLIKLAAKLTSDDFIFTSRTTANRIVNGEIKYSHFVALAKIMNRDFDEVDREFFQVKKRGRPAKSNTGALNRK